MKNLVVDKIEGYNYFLKADKQIYHLNIQFYDIKENVNEIANIYMSDNLVNCNECLSFGPINEKYGEKIISSTDEDVIVVIMKDGKEYYLKRFYG